MDEVNAEIAGIKEEIKEVAEEIGTLDTKEELDALTEDEQVQRKDLHVLLAQLEEKLATQSTEKTALEEELKTFAKNNGKVNGMIQKKKFLLNSLKSGKIKPQTPLTKSAAKLPKLVVKWENS